MLNNDTGFQTLIFWNAEEKNTNKREQRHLTETKTQGKQRMQLTVYAKVTFIIVLGIIKE